MIEQRVAKGTVRWPSVSEMLVTKGVLWWVWEALSNQRSARAYPYPTLMPSEDFLNGNWTSSVVATHVSSEIDKIAASWRHALPLLMIVAAAGAFTINYLRKKPLIVRKETVAVVAEPKGLMEDTPEKTLGDEVPPRLQIDAGRQLASFEKETGAVSTIKEVIGLTSAEPRPAAKSMSSISATSMLETSPRKKRVINKVAINLALSEVSITIDIPPSSSDHSDDAAIVQLSELLERW